MTAKRILVIGGYGNFGSHIARHLAKEPGVRLVIAGRSRERAAAFCVALDAVNEPEYAAIDVAGDPDATLDALRPDIVIHTSGPFQGQEYKVARACIRRNCHCIDLADARDFVARIGELDEAARKAGILVVSGASSVPALSTAIIDKYQSEFATLDGIDYAIATAQQTNRGLATTSAVLSYAGKSFKTLIDGNMRNVFGWQGLHFREFRGLGWRGLGNCDIPDLELFPRRYPRLKTIRFSAGLEVPAIHLGLWLLTWLVRWRLVRSLAGAAPFLLRISRLFDAFGSDDSGFTMELSGLDAAGRRKKLVFNLTARSGDGHYIPCMPAILMALKLARDEIPERGAFPCVGFLDLDSLLGSLKHLDIDWNVTRPE